MSMQFGTYVWPQKPETLTIRYERQVQMVRNEQGDWTTVDLGPMGAVVTGEGCFVGEGAYSAFAGLIECFNRGETAALQTEHWPAVRAVLAELTLTEEPCENYVAYRFRFTEAPNAE